MSHVASHGPLAKLDSTLTSDYQLYLESAANPANSTPTASGMVDIQAYANPGDRAKLISALKKLRATEVIGTGREVDALVPISALGKLARFGSLRFATTDQAIVNSGPVTSQGDTADIAAAARTAYNINGAGVTIGVISDSFNTDTATTDHYANDVADGALPANIQVLSEDPAAGTDEGRAMAELIYDSAPGATILFATAYASAGATPLQSETTMANNIIALANAGAKVIVDDVTYTNEPMFEDGIIAQAVEKVIAEGVTYVSAAGNLGEQSYASNWSTGKSYTAGQIPRDPTALNAPTFYGGTSFNFNTSGAVNDMDSFQLGAGQSINLSFQWDSPYYSANSSSGCTNQVDCYVLNAAGTEIEGGSVTYDIGGDPVQHVQFTNLGKTTNTYNLMFVTEPGSTAPGYVKFVDFAGQATHWQYNNSAATIFGHANATGVISVGAVNYANTPAYGVSPPVLDSYSSEGGTPILFNTAGGRLSTPTYRQEPVVVGPDDDSNTFFGSYIASQNYSFSGTSASAASVAAVVALILQANPSLTPAAVTSALETRAISMGTTSPNYLDGYGLVQTVPSVASVVGNIYGTVYQDPTGSGTYALGDTGVAGVEVYLDTSNSGRLLPGDAYTYTAADGSYAFYNQPAGTTVVRVLTPSGYVATTGSKTVTVVGGSGIYNNNLFLFPDTYTGTNTKYTLQLTANASTTVGIYVNGTLTYSAPLSIVPSFGFNLNGSSSVTINFANGYPIPSGGVGVTGINNSTGNSVIINGTSANDTATVNVGATTFDGGVIAVSGIQSQIINGGGGNDIFNITGAPPSTESLTFNGGVGNDTLTVGDILANNGTGVTFNAGTGSTDQNTLNVNAGTFTFSGNPAAQSANLNINVGSTVIQVYNDATGMTTNVTEYGNVVFSAGALGSGFNQRSIAGLNLSAGTTAMVAAPPSHADRAVLITNTLSIAPTGKLDLSGNDLIVTSGNLGTINALLGTGYNNGNWNGSGIASSAAASDSTHLTALGSILNNATGSPLFGSNASQGTFDGVSPAAGAVLIKYTYYGDTNLDGKIDGSDYSRVDNGYLHPATYTGWENGDFNYDSYINGSDYTLLDNAFNTQGKTL